jgi:hypothetical protein
LVVPAIAETTTATRSPAATCLATRPATLRMRSRSATEVPPYFCTTSVKAGHSQSVGARVVERSGTPAASRRKLRARFAAVLAVPRRAGKNGS